MLAFVVAGGVLAGLVAAIAILARAVMRQERSLQLVARELLFTRAYLARKRARLPNGRYDAEPKNPLPIPLEVP